MLLAVAALTLAGCGRKGPLDLPPVATPQTSAAMQGDTEAEQAHGHSTLLGWEAFRENGLREGL